MPRCIGELRSKHPIVPHCLKTHMVSSVFQSETERVSFAEGQAGADIAVSA